MISYLKKISTKHKKTIAFHARYYHNSSIITYYFNKNSLMDHKIQKNGLKKIRVWQDSNLQSPDS